MRFSSGCCRKYSSFSSRNRTCMRTHNVHGGQIVCTRIPEKEALVCVCACVCGGRGGRTGSTTEAATGAVDVSDVAGGAGAAASSALGGAAAASSASWRGAATGAVVWGGCPVLLVVGLLSLLLPSIGSDLGMILR